jgi:hypothetical protein
MRGLLLTAIAASFVLFGHDASAQTRNVQRQNDAEAVVQGANPDADAVEVGLSGLVAVTFRVQGTSELKVEPLSAATDSRDWHVRLGSSPIRKEVAGRATWEQTFFLEPMLPGDVPLPLTPLRYRDGPKIGGFITAEWQPVTVRVTTEISRPSAEELRDLTVPEELPPLPPSHWLRWTAVGVAVLILSAAAWKLMRRLGRKPPPPSPHEWALAEIDRIETLVATDATAASVLSEVVRKFLELRYGLPASRRTTAEFLTELRAEGPLSGSQQEALGRLLETSDLAKFANRPLSGEEWQGLVILARQIIQEGALPPPGS